MTKTLSYKQVIAAVKKENVGELQPLPVVGDVTIKGFCRPLKGLVQMVAELFLSNKCFHGPTNLPMLLEETEHPLGEVIHT